MREVPAPIDQHAAQIMRALLGVLGVLRPALPGLLPRKLGGQEVLVRGGRRAAVLGVRGRGLLNACIILMIK